MEASRRAVSTPLTTKYTQLLHTVDRVAAVLHVISDFHPWDGGRGKAQPLYTCNLLLLQRHCLWCLLVPNDACQLPTPCSPPLVVLHHTEPVTPENREARIMQEGK